jgi:hypothetical protein
MSKRRLGTIAVAVIAGIGLPLIPNSVSAAPGRHRPKHRPRPSAAAPDNNPDTRGDAGGDAGGDTADLCGHPSRWQSCN